ncbi:MAG: hypothetical protein KJO07_16080 [Deltaproteobacteria bacterium]|nr:hypothetical protein [Deltaproteobacteria bacterium]
MVSRQAVPEQVVAQVRGSLGTSRTACAGTAAAFLLRQLADKTGLPHSPTAERLLFTLGQANNGADVDRLGHWFDANTPTLRQLGLRVVARRVAFKTPWVLDWVGSGNGFRGAVLQTNQYKLYAGRLPYAPRHHAVALAVDGEGRKQRVAMVDPWPGSEPMAKPPDELERAHRASKYGTVLIHWTGWR